LVVTEATGKGGLRAMDEKGCGCLILLVAGAVVLVVLVGVLLGFMSASGLTLDDLLPQGLSR